MYFCIDFTDDCEFRTHRHVYELLILIILSLCGAFLLKRLLKEFSAIFIKAGFCGTDLNKIEKPVIPEAQGVLAGAVFMIIMFLFIPIPFWKYIYSKDAFLPRWNNTEAKYDQKDVEMHFNKQFIKYLAGLLSMCCMIFLGFADDSLDLRWRHKLILPSIASLPLLMVHIANEGTTTIIVPIPLRAIFGFSVDIGILYYLYMGMLAVFCTNAINIYAGVNGLEAGQSFIIGLSIILFNIIELQSILWRSHLFSLYFLIPFVSICATLLYSNWYPAEVFVGDTFCYFAGMMFAVVGILGHFSKTLILFFLPQVVNFLLSTPQLFRVFPCPRHRLPTFNPNSGQLNASSVEIRADSLGIIANLCLRPLSLMRLVRSISPPPLRPYSASDILASGFTPTSGSIVIDKADTELVVRPKAKELATTMAAKVAVAASETKLLELTNLTLINLVLRWFGPCHEATLTIVLLTVQIFFTIMAFTIRYPIAHYFYGTEQIL